MEAADLQDVDTYVSRRQNTSAQYIAGRPIIDLYLAAKWRLSPRVEKRWWEQEGLDLVGMLMADWGAE